MSFTVAEYWSLIHAERTRVADMLAGLDPEQWQTRTLCIDWSVEETTAHITATSSTGLASWVWSMLRAGFRPAKHNARKVRRYRGKTPEETLAIYRRAIPRTIAPTKDYAAFLGEVIVHGQDIARPLDITLTPDPIAVREVASFSPPRISRSTASPSSRASHSKRPMTISPQTPIPLLKGVYSTW